MAAEQRIIGRQPQRCRRTNRVENQQSSRANTGVLTRENPRRMSANLLPSIQVPALVDFTKASSANTPVDFKPFALIACGSNASSRKMGDQRLNRRPRAARTTSSWNRLAADLWRHRSPLRQQNLPQTRKLRTNLERAQKRFLRSRTHFCVRNVGVAQQQDCFPCLNRRAANAISLCEFQEICEFARRVRRNRCRREFFHGYGIDFILRTPS